MPVERLPVWLRSKRRFCGDGFGVDQLVVRGGLHTVCSEARCPNLGHCFSRGTATFLLLGNTCTRNCQYCAITKITGQSLPFDSDEPRRVVEAVSKMNLKFVVLTSVTRDDLFDGGAGVFADVVRMLKETVPGVKVETLVPDFGGRIESLSVLADSGPDVFNHNLETTRGLFSQVRPMASYERSLQVLRDYGRLRSCTPLKSGLMLGMGESRDDLMATLSDLRSVGVSMLTMGQYLRPTDAHWPVGRYVPPEEFDELARLAESMGFVRVVSGPLVRSSYHADEVV